MFKNIGIIGAGAMGSAIAEVFAYNEFNVVLKDVNMDFATRGLKHIEKLLMIIIPIMKGFQKGRYPELSGWD